MNKEVINKKENVLIVGAGVAGQELSEEIKRHLNNHYEVVGFLDDNKKLEGRKVGSIEVLGKISFLSKLVQKYRVSQVFIAIPSAQGSLIRDVIKSCEKERVVFKIVPRILEIIEGKVKLSKVKEIEVEDLLGRAIIKSDQRLFKKEFKDKTVLVTGAAGSIGSEICRQILGFFPKKLIALDFWESGLYNLELDLLEISNKELFECVVANIQDYERVKGIVDKEKPDIIFHAAAYKHVPLMQKYPYEAVENNVFGTENMAKAATNGGVEKFVNISTDKAVDPSSVMGATKLLAEFISNYYNKKGKTKFCSVRFGNVLGSQGSIVPTFKKQIAKGGPVTVTSKRMTRFFMTIPEAVQLVLNASLFVKEGGEIFMLDMGEPVNIDGLARLMIRLAGLVPGVDIQIEYSGIRPGEKIAEKLITETENVQKTLNKRIFLVEGNAENLSVNNILDKLRKLVLKEDNRGIMNVLKDVAPNIK